MAEDKKAAADSAKVETKKKSTKSVKYESNPFLVSISGLMTMLKVNPVPSLLLGVLLTLIAVGGFIIAMFSAIIPIVGILVILAFMIALVPFILGAYHALALASIHGESRKTEDFISETFKKLWSLVGAGVLIWLAVFGGLLLFIVPGIILACWFSLTYFVMFDENLGAIDSMKRSKQLVSGHIIEIIGAALAGGILSGASLGGGGGLLGPVLSIAPMAGRYEQLKALKASGAEKPGLHWMNILLTVLYSFFIVAILTFYIIVGIFSVVFKDRDYLDRGKTRSEKRLEQQLKDLERDLDQKYDYDSNYDYDFGSQSITN